MQDRPLLCNKEGHVRQSRFIGIKSIKSERKKLMKDARSRFAIPYIVYMVVFVVLPLFVICYYAFTGDDGSFTLQHFYNFFLN